MSAKESQDKGKKGKKSVSTMSLEERVLADAVKSARTVEFVADTPAMAALIRKRLPVLQNADTAYEEWSKERRLLHRRARNAIKQINGLAELDHVLWNQEYTETLKITIQTLDKDKHEIYLAHSNVRKQARLLYNDEEREEEEDDWWMGVRNEIGRAQARAIALLQRVTEDNQQPSEPSESGRNSSADNNQLAEIMSTLTTNNSEVLKVTTKAIEAIHSQSTQVSNFNGEKNTYLAFKAEFQAVHEGKGKPEESVLSTLKAHL